MTPAEIQKLVADVLGVPFRTVAVYARFLREAGLLTRGGRGRSAARMGADDAARLLVAICSSQGPGEGPDALRRFDAMPLRSRQGDPLLFQGAASLDQGPVEAIASLIERFRDGPGEEAFVASFQDAVTGAKALRITFVNTEPSSVTFRLQLGTQDHAISYRQDGAAQQELITARLISGYPLLRIGRVMRNA